jgi:predicted enzyme related to lactoylglutathione lyase
MSNKIPALGVISWTDLTVKDAEGVRHFYEEVAEWKSSALEMGGYSDYCMAAQGTGETVAGICHARGENADIPPQWLVYITVRNLPQRVRRCLELGGKVIRSPRQVGEQGSMAVIEDPAGAIVALFEHSKSS